MTGSDSKASARIRQMRGDQRRVEEILVRLANITDFPPVGTVITENLSSLRDFQKRYPKTAVAVRTEHLSDFQKHYPDIFADLSEADLRALQYLLRRAWPADPGREWFCFLIRKFGADVSRLKREFDSDGGQSLLASWAQEKETIDNALNFGQSGRGQMIYNLRDAGLIEAARKAAPPEMTPFEQIFLHLQRNLRRALVCKNHECPAPYFFRLKRGQLFCSTDCYQVVKRQRDSDWWREHRSKESKPRS